MSKIYLLIYAILKNMEIQKPLSLLSGPAKNIINFIDFYNTKIGPAES